MKCSSDFVVSVSLACSSSTCSLISQSMLEPASELKHKMYIMYQRQRILQYYNHGYKPPTVLRLLREEGLLTSRRGIEVGTYHYVAV